MKPLPESGARSSTACAEARCETGATLLLQTSARKRGFRDPRPQRGWDGHSPLVCGPQGQAIRHIFIKAALPASLSFIRGTAKSRAGNTLRTDNPQSHNYFPPLSAVPLQPESSVIKALDFRGWEAAALTKGMGQGCSGARMLGGWDAGGSGCSEARMLRGRDARGGRDAQGPGCSQAGMLGDRARYATFTDIPIAQG